MADKRATTAGPWSTRTWVPAGAPGPGDRVFADGKAITIDVDITCDSIHTEANVGIAAVAGGSFTVTTTRNVTCNSYAGTTTCLIISGAGACNLVGSGYGGASTSAHGVSKTSSGNFVMVGNGYGGSGTAAQGVSISPSGGVHVITGSGFAGGGNSACGIDCNSTFPVTINGNGNANSASSSAGGIRAQSTGTVIVNGLAIGNAGGSNFGVIGSGAASQCFIQGMEFPANGSCPIQGYVRFLNTNPTIKIFKEDGSSPTLTDVSEIAGQLPAQTDVRKGVSYLLGIRIGTLEVPPKAAVVIGVPTDNGVGTLNPTVDVSSLAADLLNEIASSNNPIAERLRNASTVESVGEQLAAM